MATLIDLNPDNFEPEVLKSEILVIVDFGAEWCAPCKKIHPIMEQIAAEMGGRVKAGYLDVGSHPQIAQQYAVMSVPRLIFFKEGKPVDSIVGFIPKEKIMDIVNKHL